MRSLLFGSWLLIAAACSSKDEESDDEFIDDDASADMDEGSSDAGATADGSADGGSSDGGTADEGNSEGGTTGEGETDGEEDGASEDTGPTDTGEEEIPDFEVDGIYEGTFAISLDVIVVEGLDPLEDTCTGSVVFIVEEDAENSISGSGSCSFSETGALAGFVTSGLVDSLGPFEGVTTGEVLTRPDASGTIAIDTSIGEITTEWTGVFADATDDAVAALNGSLDGSLMVDLGEVTTLFGEVEIEYEGSFESVRTGDLPDDEDTGSAPDTGLDEPAGGTETGGSESGDTTGGDTPIDGTTAGGGSGSPSDSDGGDAGTGTEGDGSGETTAGSDEGGSTPPVDPTGGPTPE